MEDITENIDRPDEEKRRYRYFKLKSNGLRVMAIHDPVAVKGAASLNVNIGHWADPASHPGLAHFCEHMLFMGTTKYPNENHFSAVLSEHGGNSNAFTDEEDTNYYFDVSTEHFEESLDIFSRFFIDPLMDESTSEREVLAVDSEFTDCINQDTWRYMQLRNSAANADHPASKFGVGTKDTLTDDHTRDELLKFHSKYYKAYRMSLCVLSNETLDNLCAMVIDKFSHIDAGDPNEYLPEQDFSKMPLAYGKEQMRRFYRVVPKKDYRTLKLVFPLPSQVHLYKKKSDRYISHLIGHEGAGSICQILLSNGWSTGLEAGEMHGSSEYSLFGIDINLSPLGESHIDEIMSTIFSYIEMVKTEDYPQWIFDECKQINNIDFKFKGSSKPIKHVSTVSEHMSPTTGYDIKHVLSGAYVHEEFDKKHINSIMELLCPENMIVFHSSKKFKDQTDCTDPWYGTQYSISPISDESIAQWKAPSPFSASIHLPSVNQFIPTKFDVLGTKKEERSLPILIRDQPNSQIWYKLDDTFMHPKANLLFQIMTPVFRQTPLSVILGQLFVRILEEDLSEITYNASVAGSNFVLDVPNDGVHIYVYGYTESLCKLAEIVFSFVTNFKMDTTDQKRVKIYQSQKEKLWRKYKNFARSQAYQVGQYAFQGCVNDRFTIAQRLEVFDQITPQSLQNFADHIFDLTKVQSLIHGNVSQETAFSVNDMLLHYLNSQTLTEMTLGHIIRLPTPDTCCTIYEEEQIDPDAVNSALYYYYQLGSRSNELDTLTELYGHIISEPAFDELRTKQQLGYIVWVTVRTISCTKGIAVVIQSPSHDPVYLQHRSYEFLVSFVDMLKDLTEEQFATHVEGLITIKQQKYREMVKESNFYWAEIVGCRNSFDKDKVMIERLKEMKKQTLVDFAENLVYRTAYIAVRVFPNGGLENRTSDEENPSNIKEIVLRSVARREAWKTGHEYMPNPSPFYQNSSL